MGANESETLGIQPPPRVLFVWQKVTPPGEEQQPEDRLAHDTAENLRRELGDAVETSEVTSDYDIDGVHLGSFDLAVVLGRLPDLPTHISIVQVGGARAGTVRVKSMIYNEYPESKSLAWSDQSVSRIWNLPPGQSDDEATLTKSDLVPLFPVGARPSSKGTVQSTVLNLTSRRLQLHEHRVLLEDVDKKLAGLVVRRAQTGSEEKTAGWHWILPEGASAAAWVRLALKTLNVEWPEKFPLLTGWKDVEKYRTPAEQEASVRLAALEQQRRDFETTWAEAMAAASIEVDRATQEAEGGIRKLVTEQGEDLVDAVLDALTSTLGFQVSKSDTPERRGDLLEDLQVCLPEGSEPVLVEVRGYKGGAKSSDLQRISRFERRYLQESKGQPPAGRWYVVNQFILAPPKDRGVPLSNNKPDVGEFGKDGGAVIGTPALLELCLLVLKGSLSQQLARDALWNARGFFTIPSLDGEAEGVGGRDE